MKISKKMTDIEPSATLAITSEAKRMKRAGLDVISFGAGEPDFDTPDYIKAEAKSAIDGGFTKYTPASGAAELKEAVVEKLKRDNGLNYTAENIVVSNGAKHSLYNTLQALCGPGDEVLVASPYWLSYPVMARLAGGIPKIIETDKKEGYKLTPDKLKSSLGQKTRALILNSPSNPAGIVYDKAELEAFADIAVENDIAVISDEIYEKIIYDDREHISIASLGDGIHRLTVTINGLSKSHCMTGWRIGYLAAPKDLANAVSNFQSQTTSNPSSISQKGALAALKGGDESIRSMVAEFDKRRKRMMAMLDDMKLDYIKPQGAFYIFADISRSGLSSMEFARRLLDEEKLAVIPGEPFGMKGFVRLSFAASTDDIARGLERLSGWLSRL